MPCALREVRDEDLPALFEQWADPVAAVGTDRGVAGARAAEIDELVLRLD